jgi:hypothetical protein
MARRRGHCDRPGVEVAEIVRELVDRDRSAGRRPSAVILLDCADEQGMEPSDEERCCGSPALSWELTRAVLVKMPDSLEPNTTATVIGGGGVPAGIGAEALAGSDCSGSSGTAVSCT